MSKRTRGAGIHGKPTYNQASKVVAKFGGEAKLARALGVSRITIYRWQYASPYGTDGMVPSSAVSRVQQAARLEGIVLTDSDWAPQRIDYEESAA